MVEQKEQELKRSLPKTVKLSVFSDPRSCLSMVNDLISDCLMDLREEDREIFLRDVSGLIVDKISTYHYGQTSLNTLFDKVGEFFAAAIKDKSIDEYKKISYEYLSELFVTMSEKHLMEGFRRRKAEKESKK